MAPEKIDGGMTTALLAGCVVAGLTFNAFFAAINAHVFALAPLHVMAAEALIVGLAFGTAIMNWRSEMGPWALLLIFLLLNWLTLSVIRQDINPKLVRDVILIPVFAMLGVAAYGRVRLVSLMVICQTTVLAIMLLELVATDAYSSLFKVISYYVNTRGVSVEDFWNESSDLFISATRPDARFLPFFGAHRLSSIFLEPVTLGNYVAIMTAILLGAPVEMRPATRAYMWISTAMLLCASDGRLALGVCAAMFLCSRPFVVRWSAQLAPSAIPAILTVTCAAVWALGFRQGEDNLPGRLAYSVSLLGGMDLANWIGFDLSPLSRAVDTGLAYVVLTQGILASLVIWAALAFGSPHPRASAFRLLVGVYLACNLLVSYSIFSIKSAALLWFIAGYVEAYGMRHLSQRARAPACVPLAASV